MTKLKWDILPPKLFKKPDFWKEKISKKTYRITRIVLGHPVESSRILTEQLAYLTNFKR